MELRASSFGARLRSLRQAVGMTQEELANRAGLSPNAVSALERGQRRRPYPHTVRALAEALGDEDKRAALLAAVSARGGAASSTAAEDTPAPAPAPSSSVSFAIPRPATPLVGRERELEEVASLLGQGETRLLTLTGIGGVGKTRLATEVAREAAEDFSDGAVFVGLAPLDDPALVLSTIARTLGLKEGEGRTPAEALVDHLRDKGLLLVLDNFEHLLEAAPEVARLIEACPGLAVLATSRAPLRIRGEREYPVPPLRLPPSTRSPAEKDVLESPSGRLFLERARAVSLGFEITQRNAEAVAAICWRLAGLPLALELAAAKVRILEPAALLPRLDRALSTTSARDLPERQRTMRAALDWSYKLLSKPEQELLRRLSVFTSGFSLEAAEAVGATDSDNEVIYLLEGLVEQSLVEANPDPGSEVGHYGMLEPVRQYALERLEESGEAEELRLHHARYYLALVEAAEPELMGARQVEWLDRLERENDNLRAAMLWVLSAGDYDTAARLGWGLWSFWWLHGHYGEERRWMEVALEHELPPALRARALHTAGSMAYAQGDSSAAEEHWQEALRLSQRSGDVAVEALSWTGFGLIEMSRLDYGTAESYMQKAITLAEPIGEEWLASLLRVFLGTTLLLQGESERAERMFAEALMLARHLKTPSLIYPALYNSAQLALARGAHEKAARMLREGIEWTGRTKDRAYLAHFMEALAAVASSRNEAERSAVLIGAAEGLLEAVGGRVHNYFVPDPSLQERAVAEAHAALGDTAFKEAWERGRAMTFDQTVEYALGTEEAPATTAP